jgi:hypothetical protein
MDATEIMEKIQATLADVDARTDAIVAALTMSAMEHVGHSSSILRRQRRCARPACLCPGDDRPSHRRDIEGGQGHSGQALV